MKNVSGKEDTAFTVQYDFCLPKRFNLTFTNEKGNDEQPVVIHRSSVGAMERSIGFLIEHYGGAFPVWLSPVQVIIIPISQKHSSYVQKVAKELKKHHIRLEIDDQALSMQKRIRNAQLQKTPYILIVGDKEKSDKSVNVRTRGQKDHASMPINKFTDLITSQIELKAIF